MSKELPLRLDVGQWYVSFYNDYGDSQTLGLTVAPGGTASSAGAAPASGSAPAAGGAGCPNACSGRGACVLGRCQCQAGYGGEDCSHGE